MSEVQNELERYITDSLKNNYRKTSVLKESNESSIYIFTHKKTGQKIVERISKNRNDDAFRAVRNREIPNLASIYEVCSTENSLITIEEFIEGENLSDIIQNKTLDMKTAIRYTYQICNALNGLHEKNVVHRDIKPANIIIGNDGSAYLIDLGIARIINHSEDSDTQSLGTAGYTAPEQYGIIQSSQSTDIYTLGIVLNKMITGVHPSIEMPKGPIKRIIEKSTSLQISKRYKSAKQMQAKLKLLNYFYIF